MHHISEKNLEATIEQLRKYRAALISSAVMGKVMVKDESGGMKYEHR